MQFAYDVSGGAPVIKKYKMAAAIAAGAVVLAPAANATGLSTSTTTSFADAVGLAMDAILSAGAPVAYSTTQGDIEHLQSVIINPGAVLRALMVGSAANALVGLNTVGTASSNGLTAVGTTGDQDPSSPSMDEGTVWYFGSSSNSLASRKITSVTTTLTTTVIVPFAANAIGDTYLLSPYSVGNVAGVTLSTNLLNVRVEIAATGAAAAVVDYELNGRGNSYLHFTVRDHVFGNEIA